MKEHRLSQLQLDRKVLGLYWDMVLPVQSRRNSAGTIRAVINEHPADHHPTAGRGPYLTNRILRFQTKIRNTMSTIHHLYPEALALTRHIAR